MGTRGKSQFSATWVSLTQLGACFNLSAREVGQYLNELGLRAYDSGQNSYIPTEKAVLGELCMQTPLKNGTLFYMWHRKRVSTLVQEHTGLVPLNVIDLNARSTALELIRAEKSALEGDDKVYYLLFDTISPRELPLVLAWALIMTHKARGPVYHSILDGIDHTDIPAINAQLKRLDSTVRLDESGDDGS